MPFVDDDDRIRRSEFARLRCFLLLGLDGRRPNLSGSMRRTRVNRMSGGFAPIIAQ